MQRVKYFSGDYVNDIEEEINHFIENNNVKIINIAITSNNDSYKLYQTLVTYEIE